MVDPTMQRLWQQFTGQNIRTPDNARLGSNLNTNVLVAPTVPVGGFQDSGLSQSAIPAPPVVDAAAGGKAYVRQSNVPTDQQIADSEAVKAIKTTVPRVEADTVSPAVKAVSQAFGVPA